MNDMKSFKNVTYVCLSFLFVTILYKIIGATKICLKKIRSFPIILYEIYVIILSDLYI